MAKLSKSAMYVFLSLVFLLSLLNTHLEKAEAASVQIGTKALGEVVKLKLNGTAREFIIVHQGKPSALYDESCNGTWLLMKDIYETRQWHSPNVNDYANSTIHSYLNSTFLNLFDANIKGTIKEVKIPYRLGSVSGPGQITDGLPTKIFLLSCYEVGFTTNNISSAIVKDGTKLDWFLEGSTVGGAANAKRIGYLNEAVSGWWMRTPDLEHTSSAWYVYTNGYAYSSNCNSSYGVRPALVLPPYLMVSEDGLVTIPPTVTVTLPSSNQSFSEVEGYSQMEVSGTVTDEDSGDKNYIQYKIDDGDTDTVTLALGDGKSGTDDTGDYLTADGTGIGFSGTVDVGALDEGAHNITITAIDDKGGVSAQTVIPFLVDKTAPTKPSFVFTSPSDYVSDTWTNTKPVTLTVTPGTDDGAGVLKTQYRLNGGEWTDYSGEITIDISGTTTVEAQSLDKVGHTSEIAGIIVKINSMPAITLDSPAPNQAFSEVSGHSVITVSGTVTDEDDDNCTVTATIGGVSKNHVVENCAGGKTFSIVFDVAADGLPEGEAEVSVAADDGR